MSTVLVAGATGYLGRHLCAIYEKRGWTVKALVRDAARAQAMGLEADELIEAEATEPETLTGIMTGVDLVVSSLGITRQRDGLSYRDVDYGANANLLDEALGAGVARFAYVHVLGADKLKGVELIDAKQAFVDRLRAADIASTVIAPSGYFSDMADFFAMAQSGRAWLFGDGTLRLNPIDGADLAVASFDAIAEGRDWLDIGGPDVFTHDELATLAFTALGKPARITHLPDGLRRLALGMLALFPRHVRGPAQFFLSAMGMDMVAPCHGTRHLSEHFAALAAKAGSSAENGS